MFETRLCCQLPTVHADFGVGQAIGKVEMAKVGIERHTSGVREGRTDGAWSGQQGRQPVREALPLCKAKYKLDDPVLTHLVPGSLVYVSWQASCVRELLDPKPKITIATQAEIDAFVARETARVRNRAGS